MTGAAGFLGCHCVRALGLRDHQVVALVRERSKAGCLVDLIGDIELVEVDLADAFAAECAVRDAAPDVVMHLAWYAEPRRYLHDVDRNLASLEASLGLLRACLAARVGRIIVAGTCLEAAAAESDTIYAQTKRCFHDVALSPSVQEAVSVVCAHVFSPFGPGEHPDRAVPSVVRSLLRGEPISVSAGTQRRDYIHVSDVTSALVTLAEASLKGTADVCTGESRQLSEVFATIGAILERPELLQWGALQVGPGESFDVEGDPSDLRDLGWHPHFSFDEAIRDSIRWWESQSTTARGTHDPA